MKDVIIILGGGVKSDGSLSASSQRRVEKAVELFNEKQASKIILSGKYNFWLDWLKKEPEKYEATAMKEYATSLGIPDGVLLTEEHSKDTLGNAYFTKINILEHFNWKNIIVITSPLHILRTQSIFNLILGHDYTIEYIPSEETYSIEEQNILAEKEKKSLDITNILLKKGTVEVGNDEDIKKLLFTVHPGYAENPKISFEELSVMLR